MNFLIKIFFVIILIFPISNSFGAMVTFIQNSEVNSESVLPGGVHFNPDGTKMFVKPNKFAFHVTSQDAKNWAPKIFEDLKK